MIVDIFILSFTQIISACCSSKLLNTASLLRPALATIALGLTSSQFIFIRVFATDVILDIRVLNVNVVFDRVVEFYITHLIRVSNFLEAFLVQSLLINVLQAMLLFIL